MAQTQYGKKADANTNASTKVEQHASQNAVDQIESVVSPHNVANLRRVGPAEMLQLQRSHGNQSIIRQIAATDQPRVESSSSTKSLLVQRLMSSADFKAGTSSKKIRLFTSIASIDKLIDGYEKLKGSLRDITQRKEKLDSINNECATYKGDQQDTVTRLSNSVVVEKSFIDPLVNSINLIRSNPKEALKEMNRGRDAFLKAETDKHPMLKLQHPDFSELYIQITTVMNNAGNRSAIMKELINEDINTLEMQLHDENVSDLMKDIIREVIANKDQIHFQETSGTASGAILTTDADRGRGIDKKYRLDMQMEQSGGSAVRLSSLVHELTHVSIQEVFANTSIHLAFKREYPDAEVIALSQHRTHQLEELDNALERTRDQWSPTQIATLKEKIEYPVTSKNTLKSYAQTFRRKGQLDDTDFNRINALADGGANNTLIEFDTVINQMMYLMTSWSIKPDNIFYLKLAEVAAGAYAWRKS